MKLYYPLRTDAQTKADDIHTWMIANSPGYGKSVSDGRTLRWSFAQQDVDSKGAAIPGSQWYVTVKDRSDGALTPSEKLAKVAEAPPDTK